MRVIGGIARGTKLYTLDGLATRPTLDRVKESLFSIIQLYIEDASVLDLFAGSGALGLEAVSRGASFTILSDSSRRANFIIQQNIIKTKFQDKVMLLEMDYKAVLQKMKEETREFDIIFLDPPYKKNLLIDAIKKIIEYDLLSQNGIIVIETDEKEKIGEISDIDINIKDIRKYGRVLLIFLEQV
ncbi:MAG: 16S rRNA (guanine(966)-N(2))-methyltransferase RsmD [Oscillospiraceae bacterium]|nr:16S rRNA (guanine(966)-N(2))-methyltransferase RsmD [Oscillospiraceae bacterium]